MKKRILYFKIAIEQPEAAKIWHVKSYLDDAINGWKGCLHPTDPMWVPWHEEAVKITRILRKVPRGKTKTNK